MEIDLIQTALAQADADALIVGLWEGESPEGDTAEIDRLLENAIGEIAGQSGGGELTGKKGETALFYTQGRLAAKRVVVAGLGKRDEASPKVFREVSGGVARQLRDKKMRRIASALHRAITKTKSDESADYAAAVVEGTILSQWEPDAYRAPTDRKKSLETFTLIEPDKKRAGAAREGLERGRILAESVNFARTLVNEPANELTPARLADQARTMAQESGLACEILDEDAMYRLGMGALLAVSIGSENRARLIVLKHLPNPGEPALALVGKGITFDTGGISIKPTEGMGAMKGDMAGAAAVLGAMRAIARLNVPVNVVGLAPCAENMPSGKAYRPGDVIRCMNGKTVEIITTDAEGRLVLADALTYAVRNLRAQRAVDVATLTGACVIALGTVATGAMTNNAEWLAQLRTAADRAGERVWELPLFEEYKPPIVSDIADLKNSGGRPGGAIMGGMFLKEFVDDIPWVHLDIAGKSTADGSADMAKGPTGVMVRTLVSLAQSLDNDR